MKVFISIPMSGRSDKDVSAEIEQIKKIFMTYISDTNPGETIEFVDNLDNDVDPSRCVDLVTEPLLYLGEAIRKMAFCDAVIFSPGHHKARGCKIEHEIALRYGLDYYHLYTDYETKCRIMMHKYTGNGSYSSKWEREL